MERCVRKDGVKVSVQRDFASVHNFELQRRIFQAGLADHLRRAIDTQHIRASFRNLSSQVSCPATQIQYAFAGLSIEQLQRHGSQFPHKECLSS